MNGSSAANRLARAILAVLMVGGLVSGAPALATGSQGGSGTGSTPAAAVAGANTTPVASGLSGGQPDILQGNRGATPLLQKLLHSPEGRKLLRGGMDAASLARLERGYKGAGSPLPLVDDTTLAALRARAARRPHVSLRPSISDTTSPVQPIQPTLSLAPGAPAPALAGLHPRLAVAPGAIVAARASPLP